MGLEYVSETLTEAEIPVQVLDFPFETNWKTSLSRELKHAEPLAVGLSVRNTDDCCFISKKSFLPWIGEIVAELRKLTQSPVFLGGVGFSTMPEMVLKATGADGGIEGDGEEVMMALAQCLMKDEDFTHLPNLVHWHDGEVVRNPRTEVDLKRLPPPRRRTFDNRRYQQLGAMVGIETKRGCPQKCIFCADPIAKGRKIRLRPPQIVVQELEDLLQQGISWLHTCDSEFNLPLEHAKDVCRAIINKGVGDKIRWYCYCSPTPFDRELVRLMKAAGCAGINFGIDSLCDKQLHRLGRAHSVQDVAQIIDILHDEGLNYMIDLLMGGPGETRETVQTTINKTKELNIPLAGISTGVRVYPHTPLGKAITDGSIKGGLYPDTGEHPEQPLFYLSPLLGDDASVVINELVAEDPRFLVLSKPAEEGSYNYTDDEVLSQLIKQGARGAYWDIIQQHRMT